jgi:NAD(P)-dependent dehydrogenase (short-subunit alcohol dehydrogenase family)
VGVKVLVVEDSKFLRVSTERVLAAAGYQVVSAGDGEEALRMARQELPALILLDVYASEDERAGRAEGVEERRCDGGNSRDDVDQFVAEECESTGKRWSCRILREIGWHAGIGYGFAAGRN